MIKMAPIDVKYYNTVSNGPSLLRGKKIKKQKRTNLM